MKKNFEYSFFEDALHVNFNIAEIKILVACVDACKLCINSCLSLKLRKEALLCLECAEIAELLIKFKCIDTHFVKEVAKLFRQICKACKSALFKLNFIEAKNVIELCSIASTTIKENNIKTQFPKEKKSKISK